PICNYCKRGEFFKSMNKEHAKEKFPDFKVPEEVDALEEGIIKNCIVEDIGGFLYAEAPPVKRTSAFQVSYALPVKEYALESVIEPQLQARHAQMKKVGTKENRETKEAQEQMIYYVETGSALYGFTFNLDFEKIGYSSIQSKPLLMADELKLRSRFACSIQNALVPTVRGQAKQVFPCRGHYLDRRKSDREAIYRDFTDI
ncbi:MAG: DevR family CRISPR-associated autoregulator, partial [Candidatus Bathyarchaeia archaeon]